VGEVVLGDRNFGTFATLVLLKRQGVDVVSHRHQACGAGTQTIKRLGKDDHLVCWSFIPKKQHPVWLDTSMTLLESGWLICYTAFWLPA
jgi:hypothetical protein